MTKYASRKSVAVASAKLKHLQAAPEALHADGLERVRAFCATHVQDLVPETMTAQERIDAGLVMLALAGSVLRQHKRAEHADLVRALIPEHTRQLAGIVKDIVSVTESVQESLGERHWARSAQLRHMGADGHFLTHECALKLRLCRYFERAGGELMRCMARAWRLLARHGAAYNAWSMGWPVLLCDLNDARHRRVAHLAHELAAGDLAIVSAPIAGDVHAQLTRTLAVVEDELGAMSALIGRFAPVVLLERRLGGWTVTFPTAAVHARVLEDKRLPALARAMAACMSEAKK